MKRRTNLKNLVIGTFLVLILSTVNACAMNEDSNKQNNSKLETDKPFRFEDYKTVEEALVVLNKLYPAGTSVTIVKKDITWCNWNEINDKEHGRIIFCRYSEYKFPVHTHWNLALHVSELDKIKEIFVTTQFTGP